MITLFIFHSSIFLGVLLLTILILIISQRGFLGKNLQNSFKTNSLGEYYVLVIMITGIIMMLFYFFSTVIYNLITDSGLALGVFIKENINTVPSQSFLPSLPTPEEFFTNISNIFTNGFIKNIFNFFRPVAVEGHLDDLLGQQLFIHFLLVIIVIGLILLCSVYFFITIMLNNKEFILKRFNNRFILFYIKYQVFLAKLSLFFLPLLILLGLIHLFIGLHFLITHPIPFEKLPIDLHTYFKK